MPGRRSPAAVAAAVTTVLALPASAPAAATETRVTATGALAVTWAGDPARGCAEAGVCDVRGSAVVEAGSAAEPGGSSVEPGTSPEPSLTLDARPARIRVERGPADDPVGVCAPGADRTYGSELRLAARSGRLVLDVLAFPGGGVGLGAGVCAGPRPADLAGALPSVPVGRLRAVGPSRLDLTGRRPFTAGAFSGTVASTVVVTVRRRRVADEEVGIGPPGGGPEEPRFVRRRIAVLETEHRVEGLRGGLGLALGAPAAPRCRLLDACGLGGTVALAVLPAPRAPRLRVSATLPLGRGRPALGAALAALRSGRLPLVAEVDGGFGLRGAVTASVRRGDAAPCRDLRDVALPPLVADATAPGAVTLAIGGESSVESDDPLRTRCPGPGRGDLVGGGALASGSVAAAGLAGPTARVRLVAAPVRRAARLDARLSGEVEVRLRRTGARVRVVRDWVFVEGGA